VGAINRKNLSWQERPTSPPVSCSCRRERILQVMATCHHRPGILSSVKHRDNQEHTEAERPYQFCSANGHLGMVLFPALLSLLFMFLERLMSSPRGPGCLFSSCSCRVTARRWSVESSQSFFNTMVLTGHEETTAPARCGTAR